MNEKEINEVLEKFAKNYGIKKTIRKVGFFRITDAIILFVLNGKKGIGVEFMKKKNLEDILKTEKRYMELSGKEPATKWIFEYEKRRDNGELYEIEIDGEKYVATNIATRLTYRRGRLYGFMGVYAPQTYNIFAKHLMDKYKKEVLGVVGDEN